MPQFESVWGSYELDRYPLQKRDTLQAWDAADSYLLNELGEVGGRLLIVNDSFGALSCALHGHQPVMQTDSYIATHSTRKNLEKNGLRPEAVTLIDPLAQHQGHYDLVVIRVTKTLALLEDELFRLRPHLHSASRIIGLGMVKQIHRSTLELFERIIGPTATTLARKKARLIHIKYDPRLEPGSSPYPVVYPLEGAGYQLYNHANVFSRERLDIGTRFFLQHLPSTEGTIDVVDLGCGNGVVGLMAASGNAHARVHFVDESFTAVASARATFHASGLENGARFEVADSLTGFPPGSVDLVLCNPPFHQQQVVGDAIAWRMFQQAKSALRPGGELRIVGNRHLGYHVKLKRLFGNQRQIAANRKFVVLSSVK